jgi:hypothetical protein
MTGPTGGPVRRALRSFFLGSGPLKRTSDRVQMVARIVLLLAILAGPGLAVVAAAQTHGHLEVTAAAQAAERHQVRAVVLERKTTKLSGNSGTSMNSGNSGNSGLSGDPGYPSATIVRATVGWPGPKGSTRHAGVLVSDRTAIGSTVPVWVDRTGQLSTPPMDPAAIGTMADTVAMSTAVAVPLLAWGLYSALCLVLNLRRQRLWTQGWARVEREWRTGSAL